MIPIVKTVFWRQLFSGRHEPGQDLFPVDRGFEREIKKRVEYFDNLRREKQKAKKKEGQE